MPTTLTDRPEETIRQFLTDNIVPANIHGYDPTQTDSTATDFLPITCDWSDFGDTYPKVVVQENESATVVGGGVTNATGLQGDGSGVNQYSIQPISVSVQAVQLDGTSAYLDSTEYDDLTHDIYEECHRVIQATAPGTLSEVDWVGPPTPPTQTRSSDETDSGSTITWTQRQGTVPVAFTRTP